jgi:phage gp29-like protein
MANGNSWFARLATSLIPGTSAFFAPPSIKEPSRKDLTTAVAHVDPSKLTSSWQQSAYNPSWLVTRKGLAIYDQMKRDEQVKAALKFKKDSVLAAGWEIASPGDQEDTWEVTEFVREALEKVEGGLNGVLVDVLTALDYGYSVSERVYAEEDIGKWKNKLILKRVQSLKPHYIDFVTDEFGQLQGILQQIVGQYGDPLPPAKFIIYTHAKEFGNFYGIADLEAAYRPWWVKDNAYKWLAVTLERYGMAPLFALYDPSSYSPALVDELKKVIKGIQNASLGVIPRASAEALELWSQNLNKGSSELFLLALDRFDQHLARAVLVPDLIGMSSNTGQTGSLARSQSNQDSFLQVVMQLQQNVATAVMNAQVIPQLCDLNWPSLQSYPIFSFLPFTDIQRLEIIKTWTTLVGGQVVNKIEDDETHIRKVMGFPENENPEVIAPPPPVQPGVGVDAQGKPIKLGPDGQPLKLGPDGRPWKGPPKAPGEKKPNPFEKKLEQDELSDEMCTFAEEHDAVWMEMEDGQRVAVPKEEVGA